MACGGAETRLMELFRISNPDNVCFDFCMFNKEPGYYDSEIKALGGQIIQCPLAKNILLFTWHFYRLLKKGKYDVVHSHVLLFSGICLTIAKWAGIKKRIAHMRSTSDSKRDSAFRRVYRKLTAKLILKNATDIIGISNGVLTVWFGRDWRNNPKISLIYNGLDTTPYHCESDPAWLKCEFDIPSNYKTVAHVGRFDPSKNHTKLVNIAQSFLAGHGETCFILVGDGKLRSEIEDSVTAKGLAAKFRFTGVRSDVARIMRSADAFLFPSAWEGLGGAVVEAVAAGLPMVVSDLPAIREIFDICGSGELLPVDAPDSEWAAVLKKAVNSPRQDQWLGELEKSVFSLDNAWQNLLSVYQND
jgi:glycosyltransferase involved in cell wall biosynthesis